MKKYELKKCTIDRVIDGDSVVAMIDLGYDTFSLQRIRLAGVSTPEMRSKEEDPAAHLEEERLALEAKKYVQAWAGKPENKDLIINVIKIDSYGRLVSYLTNKEGDTLSQSVISSGHGVPYVKAKA